MALLTIDMPKRSKNHYARKPDLTEEDVLQREGENKRKKKEEARRRRAAARVAREEAASAMLEEEEDAINRRKRHLESGRRRQEAHRKKRRRDDGLAFLDAHSSEQKECRARQSPEQALAMREANRIAHNEAREAARSQLIVPNFQTSLDDLCIPDKLDFSSFEQDAEAAVTL